ncbi:MAG: hypothetical protein KC420_14230 [Myxococcales bacterium]|nr:hypothetical protein [Myxococcales bacterium]MCB9570008.1 hypothetical protein [Myxococcales bacterium]MCB9703313.1 hypothetical protein [Myxococcales bacterium]
MRVVDPGLCGRCAESRPLVSGRGSTFWRCGVHDRDPRVPKYPPLPVRRCPFFRAGDPEAAPA